MRRPAALAGLSRIRLDWIEFHPQGAWAVVPTPNPGGGGQNVLNAIAIGSLAGVGATATTAWAFGNANGQTLAEQNTAP